MSLHLKLILVVLYAAIVSGQNSFTDYTNNWTFSEDTTSTVTTTERVTTVAPEYDSSWEDMVLSGPATVNYLGLFMVLSSKKNYFLTYPSGKSFQNINNNAALKNTLKSLSSSIKLALESSQDDLERVSISLEQIPDHIKSGLLLIQTAPIDLVQKLLPYTIRNIERATKEASLVSRPVLGRAMNVGVFINELSTLVKEIKPAADNADFLVEAQGYADDLEAQWSILTSLFGNISYRADLTRGNIERDFIDVIHDANSQNAFQNASSRNMYLQKMISLAVSLDKHSDYLNMIIRTYSEIVQAHLMIELESNGNYTELSTDSQRVIVERELWKKLIAQSISVTRLTQKRQTRFASGLMERHADYSQYSNSTFIL